MPTHKIKCGKCDETLLANDMLPEHVELHHRKYPGELSAFFFGNSPPRRIKFTADEFRRMDDGLDFGSMWNEDDIDFCNLRCRTCSEFVGRLKLRPNVRDAYYAEIEFLKPSKKVLLIRESGRIREGAQVHKVTLQHSDLLFSCIEESIVVK